MSYACSQSSQGLACLQLVLPHAVALTSPLSHAHTLFSVVSICLPPHPPPAAPPLPPSTLLQGRPSDKAIPLGATGLLVTCDSGREYKAFDEMMRLLEEVREEGGRGWWW